MSRPFKFGEAGEPSCAAFKRGAGTSIAAAPSIPRLLDGANRFVQHRKPEVTMKLSACLARGLGLLLVPVAVYSADTTWQSRIAEGLGKAGTETPDGVYRVSLPRTDLKVKLDGVEIKPALALGSWLGFVPLGADVMVMGDLVLTGAEVAPVTQRLREAGIEITALHNHLLRNEPFTMYLHVHAQGEPGKLAASLRAALAASKTPLVGATPSASASADLGFDTATVDRVLGYKGKANGGVYAVNIRRAQPVKDDGMDVPEGLGSATAINLQASGDGKIAATGDFVLTANEVNPVIAALTQSGIEITALHNHMLTDEPRLFFMHFWANDLPERVLTGLRAALDKVAVAKE
jgi:hypothetical protein